MFSKGFLVIGRFRGAPIRVHWSTPLGMLFFTGLRFAPGAWLAFVIVILVHELGHAAFVVRSRQRVVSVDAYAVGGLCWWSGYPSPTDRALIAWGGVIAQAVLGLVTMAALAVFGQPGAPFAADLVHGFLGPNFGLILMNLLPVPPLDGAEAWRIVPILASRWQKRRDARKARVRATLATRTALRSLDEVDELPPMPDEVKRVLDRVTRDGRAQHEAERKKQHEAEKKGK